MNNKPRPIGSLYWYSGNLSPFKSKTIEPEALRAYRSWADQRHRCRNKKLKSYKYYGAKGVQVKYLSREFVGWWLEQQMILNLKKPTISRIDHSGHYEFGNIKLEEHKNNCIIDVLNRFGPPSLKTQKPIIILDKITLEPLMIARSSKHAGLLTGVPQGNVTAICLNHSGKPRIGNVNKTARSGKGYTFRYSI